MYFSSLIFLLYFLPVTLVVYYVIPKDLKNYWLLISSLLFYYWGVHRFLRILLLSILCNYIFALLIEKTRKELIRKMILIFAVLFNLGILLFKKYLNFITTNLNLYFDNRIPITHIILPMGISFFSFQIISYLVDVYRKDVSAQKNIYKLGLYISFFPQLVAGPIVRYKTIEDQINNRNSSLHQFCDGTRRFMIGFSQKVLLSNSLSVLADEAFENCSIQGNNMSIIFAWMGAIAYSLQILFDFSGYSSMAIGIGKMFGFEFMENFNYPYVAKNITDFWRRWHISLSQWFRDYVYIPLGGEM